MGEPSGDTTPICRCRVLYLGSSVPHITKDGLQGIQEPLRELYPSEGISSAKGIDSWLSVWSNGLLLENVDEKQKKVTRFFPIESLHYCAAVRYVIVPDAAAEKQQVARFLPLDSPFARSPSIKHPPLFAAILRRTTGIKVLECHVFICKRETPTNALVRCCFHAYGDSMHARQMDGGLYESIYGTVRRGTQQPRELEESQAQMDVIEKVEEWRSEPSSSGASSANQQSLTNGSGSPTRDNGHLEVEAVVNGGGEANHKVWSGATSLDQEAVYNDYESAGRSSVYSNGGSRSTRPRQRLMPAAPPPPPLPPPPPSQQEAARKTRKLRTRSERDASGSPSRSAVGPRLQRSSGSSIDPREMSPMTNGHVNGHANGHGPMNGHANGHTNMNGHVNGIAYTNGRGNGHGVYMNGQPNGQIMHMNGQPNGHGVYMNGHGNGHGVYMNGHGNGQSVYMNGQSNGQIVRMNGNGQGVYMNGNGSGGYMNGHGSLSRIPSKSMNGRNGRSPRQRVARALSTRPQPPASMYPPQVMYGTLPPPPHLQMVALPPMMPGYGPAVMTMPYPVRSGSRAAEEPASMPSSARPLSPTASYQPAHFPHEAYLAQQQYATYDRRRNSKKKSKDEDSPPPNVGIYKRKNHLNEKAFSYSIQQEHRSRSYGSLANLENGGKQDDLHRLQNGMRDLELSGDELEMRNGSCRRGADSLSQMSRQSQHSRSGFRR